MSKWAQKSLRSAPVGSGVFCWAQVDPSVVHTVQKFLHSQLRQSASGLSISPAQLYTLSTVAVGLLPQQTAIITLAMANDATTWQHHLSTPPVLPICLALLLYACLSP
ncbi:hypothetical protein PCASD_14266 [Puccinia coronata f. sp. avenae]|uniref:Uncharacterized protein n=1 Tax=Puccinia coronata f. sp. avenae TaxID=200324 RepID=A0A2N5TF03_9BASI|nr:hypothetical protein PCASD_14266 [Puccinia coronata f. sp. avenae]